jgi:hypothetical protein
VYYPRVIQVRIDSQYAVSTNSYFARTILVDSPSECSTRGGWARPSARTFDPSSKSSARVGSCTCQMRKQGCPDRTLRLCRGRSLNCVPGLTGDRPTPILTVDQLTSSVVLVRAPHTVAHRICLANRSPQARIALPLNFAGRA